VTETGSKSRTAGFERDVGVKSTASKDSYRESPMPCSCSAHEYGSALARPVTVRSAGAVPINDRRDDAGRNEGEGCQQADVPFALGFTLGNLGERGDPTEPDVVDPSSGLGDCSVQGVPALGLHRRLLSRGMKNALYRGEAWRRPCERDLGCSELPCRRAEAMSAACPRRGCSIGNRTLRPIGPPPHFP
jgi:hypothetical protein